MISLEEDLAQSLESALVFNAFLDGLLRPTPAQQWLGQAAAKLDGDPEKKGRRDKIVIRLLQRDGDECWFCGKPMGRDVTLEHLQPLALGGSWSDGNLALAHRGCNTAAGHLSRIKKEALREEMKSPRSGSEPNKPLPSDT